MPSLNVDVEVDISVYCGICGSGICKDSDLRAVKGHHEMTVTCSTCEQTIKDLEADKAALEEELEKLKIEREA